MPDEPRQTPDEIADAAREEIDRATDEFDSKLADLEKRAAASRQKHEAKKARVEESRKSDQSAAKGLGVGLAIAYAIIGMPLVGFGGGWLLDRSLGTTGWQGGLGLLGAFIGVGYAAWMMNKTST